MISTVNKTVLALASLFLFSCQDSREQTLDDPQEKKQITLENLALSSQEQLNLAANNLIVKYHFLSNVETQCPTLPESTKAEVKAVDFCYAAEILLSMPDTDSVKRQNAYFANHHNWQLNYSQVYPSYASQSNDFDLVHLNGDIHQITPKSAFSGFTSGQEYKVKLWVKSTLITESELMPNYWISAPDLSPVVITSTKTTTDPETGLEIQPWVVPFSNTVKQIKSAPDDINQYASPRWLYENEPTEVNEANVSEQQVDFAIIPTPNMMEVIDKNKRLDLASGFNLVLTGLDYQDVSAAVERLNFLGLEKIKTGVSVNITLNENKGAGWRAGHYELTINAENIIISTQDKTGAFYALQSLASLLTLGSTSLPLVKVDDQPHYEYRGQHVDVARNFHSKEFIFALIKQMSAYKLNKLHLHLAEDEGWRLALPSLPELTQVGSKRCLDLSDKNCLQPQLGGAGASDRDGFYSVSDYQEILRLATKHHIQVIPSLDMPGHSRAAIKAMEARYHFYMKQENEEEAKRYLLTDFDDKTQYSSIQNYNDNTLNICMESTYTFVDRVLDDLKLMHKQAGHPLALYHIGADETAGAWLDSPVCKALIEDQSNEFTDAKHLGAHFIERVAHMVTSKGIAVGGWNDGLKETSKANMPEGVYSYIWDALPWGAHIQVSEQAHRNWNIILSTPDVLYFDFPYQIDPKERGYHWASRRVTTRSLFNFMPDNLPIHAEFRVDTLGKSFISNDKVQHDEVGNITHQPLPKEFTVKGIQGQLWSETVRSSNQAEYMIYPRLIALAERAWHQASWQVPYNDSGYEYSTNSGVFTEQLKRQRDLQWRNFSQALGNKEFPKLDLAGVFYRLPNVGAIIKSGELHTNTAIKGLPVEYREQDNNSSSWKPYKIATKVILPIELRTRTTDKKRAGRSMLLTEN